jgi:hypothetical protein
MNDKDLHVKRHDRQAKQALALWAVDCAEHVLGLFEAQQRRPRLARD